jgi:hypothetical protein
MPTPTLPMPKLDETTASSILKNAEGQGAGEKAPGQSTEDQFILAPPATLYLRARPLDEALARSLLRLLEAEKIAAQLVLERINYMPGPVIFFCTQTPNELQEFQSEIKQVAEGRTVILVLFETGLYQPILDALPSYCFQVEFLDGVHDRSSTEFRNLVHACQRSTGHAGNLGFLPIQELGKRRKDAAVGGLISIALGSEPQSTSVWEERSEETPTITPVAPKQTSRVWDIDSPGDGQHRTGPTQASEHQEERNDLPRHVENAKEPPFSRRSNRTRRKNIILPIGIALIGIGVAAAVASGSESIDRVLNSLVRLLRSLFELKLFSSSMPPPAIISSIEAPGYDLVDASVFSPSNVPADEDFLVQVFLHKLKEPATARKLAQEHDPNAKRHGIVTLATEVADGQQIAILLEAPDLKIDEPTQHLRWRGRARGIQFVCRPPETMAGKTCTIKVRVLVDSVPVGALRFTIRVEKQRGSDAAEIRGEWARRYQYAFLSYSSNDRVEVLKRAQALRAAKIGYFQDLLTLEPGERFKPRIYQEIDRCDLFLLFWSSHAAQSEWVRSETEYALARRSKSGSEFPDITPIILEGPPLPTPPDSLKDIHFNDALRFVIAAAEIEQSSRIKV